ncbi:hypothetical protein [Streptomyces sp. TLI_146]|uniref:hypothetical protein n=1 Tax=Streptomyces sp. TLI_146 TaxID=1938858 RepID=UPI000C702C0E|nr:hypothetical protein [Streptomyces sp. TLI_146]PKV86950.1 hypothetical protein BX283_4540 [Streptomyces sp. TLI_146]
MALSAQWDELFAGAPLRSGGQEPSAAGMRLASANGKSADGKGGGAPDVQFSKSPWSSAGKVAGELRTGTAGALADLDSASEGVTAGTEGFGATAALEEIRTTWKDRLGAVRDECGRLDGVLKSVGKEFGEVDVKVGNDMKAVAPAEPKGR